MTKKAKKQENYKPQFSMEMRREFWKHDLNPITGMPREDDSSVMKTRANFKYHQDGFYLEKATQR